MRRIVVGALATLTVGLAAAPTSAGAATVLTGAGVCNQTSTTLPTTTAGNYTSCVAYSGNLLNQNSIADINAALDALVGGNYSPDVTWGPLESTEKGITDNGNDATGLLTFSQAISGNVIIGVHIGNADSGADQRTQFYLLNLTSPTTQLYLNTQGLSDAVVISGVGTVPEPATWALMLLGFGGIGFAMRRRRSALAAA